MKWGQIFILDKSSGIQAEDDQTYDYGMNYDDNDDLEIPTFLRRKAD